MSQIKPNITSPLELVLRLAVATYLVVGILYFEWMALVFVPFYILSTSLAGYDPLKEGWFALRQRIANRRTHVIKSSAKKPVAPVSKVVSAILTRQSSTSTVYGH
ncbi:hypothetical protein [Spirosoma fluminis]